MFCTECGTKNNIDSKFCFNCGAKLLGISESNIESSVAVEGLKEDKIPVDLLQCKQLKQEGKTIEFKNEADKVVIFVYKTGGLLEKSFEYAGFDKYDKQFTFMKSEATEAYTQTAYDADGNIIATVKFSGGLKSLAKTEIRIEDTNGEVYILEENIGMVKGVLKVISPVDYGIGSLISARTGDLIIKKGAREIGVIHSVRKALHNTYVVKNCEELREKMDLRLLLLGMTVKAHYTK